MKRICCACGAHLGDKEPLEDTSETHGYCDSCLLKGLLNHGIPLSRILRDIPYLKDVAKGIGKKD